MPITVIDISGSSDDERPPIAQAERRKTSGAPIAPADIPTIFHPRVQPLNPELAAAILSVRPERLQDSVLQLCRQNPGAAEMLSRTLLTEARNTGATSSSKRKAVTR